jgi:hypothetical protein
MVENGDAIRLRDSFASRAASGVHIAQSILDLDLKITRLRSMATYSEVLIQIESLTPDEQLRLLEYLAVLIRQQIVSEKQGLLEVDSDPLIGLFAGSPALATKSEEILQQEIIEKSGWTWKPTNDYN